MAVTPGGGVAAVVVDNGSADLSRYNNERHFRTADDEVKMLNGNENEGMKMRADGADGRSCMVEDGLPLTGRVPVPKHIKDVNSEIGKLATCI